MKTIGFIGTGLMGRAMVRNLMKAGYTVTVYTRTKAKARGNIDDGALWADSVAECVRDKDAVISMVGYPADVEEVYFGTGGILENAKSGALLIDATTSTPELAARIAAAAKARGLEALDAPVTGGERGAIDGTLVIMAGGETSAFERAMPLFEAMGKTIRYQGPAGFGQHCKMANQIGIAGALSGVCEAIAYAETAGLDPALVIDTIKGGSAGSVQMNLLSSKILARDDSPAFYLKHLLKDLKISIEESAARGRELPQTRGVMEMYQALEDCGLGDCGTQSLFRYYE